MTNQTSDVEDYQRLRASIRLSLDRIVALVKQGNLSVELKAHMQRGLTTISSHVLEMHTLAHAEAIKRVIEPKKDAKNG